MTTSHSAAEVQSPPDLNLAGLAEILKVRDELRCLIVVPPKPRRVANVQGLHSVDVIERALEAFDSLIAELTALRERVSEGERKAAQTTAEGHFRAALSAID